MTPPSSSTETAGDAPPWIDLSGYTVGDYSPGANRVVRVLWYFVSLQLFESGWFPVVAIKLRVLRLFGARVGRGVVIKPNVRIKNPWRLEIGDHTWIGQDVWIDNIADVRIGSHVCVSQGSYFCTGSHDHRTRGFDLKPGPIILRNGAWVAARAMLMPGVEVGANALVAAGSVATKSVEPATIVAGVPARVVGRREPPAGN